MHGFVGIFETSLKLLSGKTSLRSKVFKVSNLKRMRTCELMCILPKDFCNFAPAKPGVPIWGSLSTGSFENCGRDCIIGADRFR